MSMCAKATLLSAALVLAAVPGAFPQENGKKFETPETLFAEVQKRTNADDWAGVVALCEKDSLAKEYGPALEEMQNQLAEFDQRPKGPEKDEEREEILEQAHELGLSSIEELKALDVTGYVTAIFKAQAARDLKPMLGTGRIDSVKKSASGDRATIHVKYMMKEEETTEEIPCMLKDGSWWLVADSGEEEDGGEEEDEDGEEGEGK